MDCHKDLSLLNNCLVIRDSHVSGDAMKSSPTYNDQPVAPYLVASADLLRSRHCSKKFLPSTRCSFKPVFQNGNDPEAFSS